MADTTEIQLDDYRRVTHHPEQIYQCGDVSIASDSFGDKSHPPILLVMGLSTQLIHWPEIFCRMLADKGYWVIRFDNRDIGKSSIFNHLTPVSFDQLLAHRWFKKQIDVAYGLGDMAMDATHLLNVLGIDKVHVVGASMGGMIAQLMAINYPERVKSLTNIMSTTGDKRLMWPTLKVLWLMTRKPGKTPEAHLQHSLRLWRALHGFQLNFPKEMYANTISKAYERGFYESGVLRQMTAISTASDRTELLKKLTLPSLIIHGDADPLLKVKNAEALHVAMPHAEKIILKYMGHTLPHEYWGKMIDGISRVTQKA